MNRAIQIVCVAVLALGPVAIVWAEDPYDVAWTAQIRSSAGDYGHSVSVDTSGSSYVSGETYGDLDGANIGLVDAYLSKFDSDGDVLWTTQIGTSSNDASYSVAVDTSGNTYISGTTTGDLDGSNFGSSDAFLSKLDSSGDVVWTKQIGTDVFDDSRSVAVDTSGNTYISGSSYGGLDGANLGSSDAYLRKFDSDGNVVWTKQIGTDVFDDSQSVAVDASGNVYISGSTTGALGGSNTGDYDAYLCKFNSDGGVVWTKQVGTDSWDRSYSVVVDTSGNAYIGGSTEGALDGPNAGLADAFLSKFDSDGNVAWTTQIGTGSWDRSDSVAVDASGNVYISGYTQGDLGGANAGGEDAFLSKLDSGGSVLWTTQIGTVDDEYSHSVAVDIFGNVYISGTTWGDLGGTNAGSADAFLVKYEVPEPATLTLLTLGGLALMRRRRSCRGRA